MLDPSNIHKFTGLPQDHIVKKYKEKHPKLLASEPKDWDAGFDHFVVWDDTD